MRSVFFAPVYNQVRELPGLLAELRATPLDCDEILFVNNGSTDGSEEMIRRSGYRHIDVDRNRGVGFSVMLALDWALSEGYSVLGNFAGNGKMPPAQFGRLLAPLRAGEADYVTGSRFLAGGDSPNLPDFRRRSIPLVNYYVRLVTGARLTDATCGFRAYLLDPLRNARFDWHAEWAFTYGLEYYLYAKVILDGRLRWQEVPVTMRYPPRGLPYSKIRPGRDWVAMLEPWLRARMDGRGFGSPGQA